MVSVLDAASANNMLALPPVLSLNKTYITGTFKTKWNIVDTSVVGKGLMTLLDSTVKYVDSALYMDLGLASTALATDSVGAVLGNDTASFWYKGWTLPGTVVYANGKARPATQIAARMSAAPAAIASMRMESGLLVINAGAAVTAKIQLLDLSGRVRLDLGKVDLNKGRNTLARNQIKGLQNGLYFVKASLPGKSFSAKVMLSSSEAKN